MSGVKYDTNYLTNHDFESGFTAGLADGWAKHLDDPTDVYSDETSIVHSGSHAQKITSGDGSAVALRQDKGTNFIVGHVYRVRFWIYSSQYESPGRITAYLSDNYQITGGIQATTWTQITLYHTPALSNAVFFIYHDAASFDPGDWFILDDVEVQETIYTQSAGGILTPSGAVVPIPIFVQALGGELDLGGDFSALNPAWLLIDETLTWMGEWDATWSYNIDDVVLYKTDDGGEWHVFVSKIGHNVGNVPTSTASAWRRLYQELLL